MIAPDFRPAFRQPAQRDAAVRGGMRKSRAAIALLLTCSALAWPALADVIYKSVTPDGVVEYSTAPPPGNRVVKRIETRDLTPEQRRAALSLRGADGETDSKVAAAVAARVRTLNDADAEVRRAQGALLAAERALEVGREPLEGERRGTVGGHSRLAEAYFERLAKLEQAVEQAHARLNAAYHARREASD